MKGPRNLTVSPASPGYPLEPEAHVEPPSCFDTYRSLLSAPQEPQDSYMKEMANSETMFERYDREMDMARVYGGPDRFGEMEFNRHTSEGGMNYPRKSVLR